VIAILGGTAAYHLNLADFGGVGEPIELATPYGPAAALVPLAPPGGPTALFLSRHGRAQLARSAAFVNHRANLWAIREAGATAVISWNGVGAIAPGISVGEMVVPDDLLDRSRARRYTFGAAPAHEPAALFGPLFDPGLRRFLVAAACAEGERVHDGGVYLATEGPRLETAAEIEAAARDGATIVGMTLSPEVWLAQEAALPFASLAVVTNRATGTGWRDGRRDFSPQVGARALRVVLQAAHHLHEARTGSA
jgi:purine nucleoside phosphorylase